MSRLRCPASRPQVTLETVEADSLTLKALEGSLRLKQAEVLKVYSCLPAKARSIRLGHGTATKQNVVCFMGRMVPSKFRVPSNKASHNDAQAPGTGLISPACLLSGRLRPLELTSLVSILERPSLTSGSCPSLSMYCLTLGGSCRCSLSFKCEDQRQKALMLHSREFSTVLCDTHPEN